MIEFIINWFKWLLTVAPIYSITLTELFTLYIHYFILGLICLLPVGIIFRKKKIEKMPTLPQILILVPIEDVIFRYIPIYFLGFSSIAGIFGHIIWALLHGIPALVFVGISGILHLRLWLGGLWVEGLFIHLFHDIFWVSVYNYLKDKGMENEN